MKAIAIDDEPLALRLIEEYCAKVPGLDLIGSYSDPMEAAEALRAHPVDLIFLDIQMPGITGLDFLKTLQLPPMTIFTTAYDHHAVEGFNLDAVDYLLKPIPFERFLKAVNKAADRLKSRETQLSGGQESGADHIFIKADYQMVRINFSDITHIEGLDDYIKIYYGAPKPLLALMSLKAMLEKLPESKFQRVHRSYIIALDRIQSIRKGKIKMKNEVELPIGESYHDAFMKLISKTR